jgi:DHA1 family multidrug/chloramphenicol efflux transport protein-like MFS transporter
MFYLCHRLHDAARNFLRNRCCTLAGAAFILYFSWRDIFFIIAIFAFIALWGLWRYMPETVGTLKHDGTITAPVSLAPTSIALNYWKLFTNPAFLFGSFSIGFLAIPCLVWIAISPIMLITEAHLPLIHYGLWQIPIFSADIIGNLVLRRLTYNFSLKQIIIIGALVSTTGLSLSVLITFFHASYLAVIPGIIIYALGLGITIGPLSRKVLYSTQVTKGTASALMTILIMAIEAGGVELVNLIYKTHNNLYFSLYCLATGIIFLLCLVVCNAFAPIEKEV